MYTIKCIPANRNKQHRNVTDGQQQLKSQHITLPNNQKKQNNNIAMLLPLFHRSELLGYAIAVHVSKMINWRLAKRNEAASGINKMTDKVVIL